MPKDNFIVKTIKTLYTIVFKLNGVEYNHTFEPADEEDYWTAFESNGKAFDVNYDVDYGHIVVYEVVNGVANLDQSICCVKLTEV